MTAARPSAIDALQVARACLRSDDPDGACLALETGRGLVLHAATVAATVPQLLRRGGEDGLARRADRVHAGRPRRPPVGV